MSRAYRWIGSLTMSGDGCMEDKATLNGIVHWRSNSQLGLEGRCSASGEHDDAHQPSDSRRAKPRSFAVRLTQKA